MLDRDAAGQNSLLGALSCLLYLIRAPADGVEDLHAHGHRHKSAMLPHILPLLEALCSLLQRLGKRVLSNSSSGFIMNTLSATLETLETLVGEYNNHEVWETVSGLECANTLFEVLDRLLQADVGRISVKGIDHCVAHRDYH